MKGFEILTGKRIECEYNGKARIGTVIKATAEYITIQTSVIPPEYRTLRHDGIINMKVEGWPNW